MPDQSGLIYHYDGSFDGFLCCVFASYAHKEIPLDILGPDAAPSLFAAKAIQTDSEKSGRVLASIPQKISPQALTFIKQAFLTCLPQKELFILRFLRLGYQVGPSVMNLLADDTVNTLYKAVKHLQNESHLLTGFLRFSICNQVLVAEMEPKNFVLPLMARHFCERYPQERFLIHDKTHAVALVYQPYQSAFIPLDTLEIPEPDEQEHAFRRLWQLFYQTIEIQGRHNPACRMSHLPKRYWRYMTEFTC